LYDKIKIIAIVGVDGIPTYSVDSGNTVGTVNKFHETKKAVFFVEESFQSQYNWQGLSSSCWHLRLFMKQSVDYK